MHCIRKVSENLYWVGASDRRLALFENIYPIPHGVSYNAYVLLDEKTVLLDTVDEAVSGQFFENLQAALAGRKLDYVIVNHMEPDHCATLQEVVHRYPEVQIVCNQKIAVMIRQFFSFETEGRVKLVKEGDVLQTGSHCFTFVMAPMVHWPEVMVTYETTEKILFSADAFGTFGALNGPLFADQVDFARDYLPEARRYYTNIVGKYGPQVQALLKKAAGLEIEMICPLHGLIWRSGMDELIEKYDRWSRYMPEEEGVLIVYGSIYGHTENAANILAAKLSDYGIQRIALYDASVTHPSYILAEAFRYSHIVLASATYNAGIFTPMETLLLDLKAHNLQNRTVAVIENGSWAPTAGKLMAEHVSAMKNMTLLEQRISLRSSVKEEQLEQLENLAAALAASLQKPELQPQAVGEVQDNAMYKFSYGLFVLSAQDEGFDNGCIINTAIQITDIPKRIAFTVNKENKTHDMVLKTGKFNLSMLSISAPFKLFQHFGFQSGRDTNKFAEFKHKQRSQNGLCYLDKYANAFLSGKVVSAVDYGTHTLFVADVTEAKVISEEESLTYAYYFQHIKPSPKVEKQVKGFVCKICGYVYEGDALPEGYLCPLCKHDASYFEPIQA